MDLHIFADPDPDPGSQNLEDPTDLDPDPDPKHCSWYCKQKNKSYIKKNGCQKDSALCDK